MSDDTGIEWTDKTYNPWIGCTKVSPGCLHCYAETLSLQKKFVKKWGKDGERHTTKTAPDPERWNLEALDARSRYTVFCASLSDVFEDRPELVPLREDLWRLVKRTPYLDWMILTKRAENIATMLPADWGAGYDNVCLMVSVENQEWFDKRVPVLRAVPAKFRALSVEPLVGHVRMPRGSLKGIDLVIVGGESDKNARPMNPEWVRHIRDACARDKIDFFFKQWGNWTPDKAHAETDLSNGCSYGFYDKAPIFLKNISKVSERESLVSDPTSQTVYFAKSKKGTGSELDGLEHKQHPFLASRRAVSAAPIILPLTPTEKEELSSLEVIVSAGLKSFWEAGKALRKIRDRGLYRDTHKTFEAYCEEKWEMSRAEAYRQIGAASVIEDISSDPTSTLPTTISQTRPLLKLKTPEERRKAWEEANKTTGTITAEVVQKAVTKLKSPPRKSSVEEAVENTVKRKTVTAEVTIYPKREQIEHIVTQIEDALGKIKDYRVRALFKSLKEKLKDIKE